MKHAIDWFKFEVSNPRFESTGLRHVTVKSGHLRGRGDISIFLPANIDKINRVPVAVLLHGTYGSHWAWALKGGAHLTAAHMISSGEIPPIVLAMPSDGLWGDGTAYLPQDHANFESWIGADVPAAVQYLLPEVARGGPLFLGGLSMGGFGAVRVAAKLGRSVVTAASAMSACTRLDRFFEYVTERPEDFHGLPADTALLDVLLARRTNLPALHFDCGTEDVLLADNRSLAKALSFAGVAHEYLEFPGGHNWDYWEEHLPDTLRFFARHFSTT